MRKIVAIAEIYGEQAVARAIEDALTFRAFSCEYIMNLVEVRTRQLPEPGALQLTRHEDLLELEIEPPDFSAYEVNDDDQVS